MLLRVKYDMLLDEELRITSCYVICILERARDI